MVLLLNRNDVESVLDMRECMNVVENAFIEFTQGGVNMPQRISITSPEGLSLYMPVHLSKTGTLACKIVSVYRNNPVKFGIPTLTGKVVLQNPESGDVVCFMDGAYLTAMRTGAVSGIATRYLARKDKGQSVGIFGSGVQARTQLWAVTQAREVDRVLVFDIVTNASKTFSEEMSRKLGVDIVVSDSPTRLEKCDIVCTATTSTTPVLDGRGICDGSHVNGVGSHSPTARELDTTLVRRSKLIVDSREACLKEAGDIIIPIKEGAIGERHIYASLGEILCKKMKGREEDQEITVFKSVGLALQDAATAKLVYEKAVEAGVGKDVAI